MKKGLFLSVAILVLFILLSGYVKEDEAQTKKDSIRVKQIHNSQFFKLQSGVTTNLNAISYFNPARGIAVGDNGTILLTKNGGHNWQSVGWVTKVNLYGAAMVDSLIAIAVGQNGTILRLRSTDDGKTWVHVKSEYVKLSQTLRAVAFYSKKDGYAVGDSGVVFFTNNGGEKWHRVHGDRSKTLNAISFNKKNMPCIVGKGTFGQSTDHGKNWNFTRRTGANLRSIHFLGPDSKDSLGFAVGDNGVILKTTNGGRNWNSVKSPVKMNLNGVFLHSPKLGYAVGDSGTVLRYNGKTWKKLNTPTKIKLNAVDPVYLNPTSTCVGEGGYIMLIPPPDVVGGTTATLDDLGDYTLGVTVNTQNLQYQDQYGNTITYKNLVTCSTIEQQPVPCMPGSGWVLRDQFINISEDLNTNQTYSWVPGQPNQLVPPIQLVNCSGEIGYFSCYLMDNQDNIYLLSTYEIVCE